MSRSSTIVWRLRGACLALILGARALDSESTNTLDYLQSLAPRVVIKEAAPAEATDPTPAITRVQTFRDDLGYIRVARVDGGIDMAMERALADLQETNATRHLVIDLRFAEGTDYEAAARAAGLLAARSVTGFSLGGKDLPISPRGAFAPPAVMGLVNEKTRGAAEFLAIALREAARPALLLGTRTAGQAWAHRILETPSGTRLRVAGDLLTLPGGQTLSTNGWAPDLTVAVTSEDELLYFEDPHYRAGGPDAEEELTIRLNEAELVRRRLGRSAPAILPEPAPPEVRDPALARALDLLEGLQARVSAGDSR
jgi:C-terminal processing protease CtpA/Prc